MLNWGFLGTSAIAYTMARAIKEEGRGHLYALAGRSEANALKLKQAHGFEVHAKDYHDILSDPKVDAVYISLPNHLHAEWIQKAVLAKKAVLCEKSFCFDMAQTREVFTVLERSHGLVREALMYRCHPYINDLIALIDAGSIGELQHIDAYYHAPIAHLANPKGGGAILNLGCYPLSLSLMLIERFTALSLDKEGSFLASGHRRQGNIRRAQLNIQASNGFSAHIAAADDLSFQWHFDVIGDKGRIRALDNPWMPNKGINRWQVLNGDGHPEIIESFSTADAYQYQIKAFSDQCLNIEPEGPCYMINNAQSFQLMACLSDWRNKVLDSASMKHAFALAD